MARARCVVAEAEIALVSRDLGWPAKALDAARATLEKHGDRVNAAHARYLEVRRLLLIGRLDEAERALAELDPGAASARLARRPRAGRRRHRHAAPADEGRARSAWSGRAHAARRGRHSGPDGRGRKRRPACWTTPAARLIADGEERPLLLDEVEALLASTALVVDACRHVVRKQDTTVSLATRPVLFALARALAEAWPGDVARGDAARARLRRQARR